MTSTSTAHRSNSRQRIAILVGGLAVVLALVCVTRMIGGAPVQAAQDSGGLMLLTLALPVYLTGVLSLLSPCCLPILPAYFSITFGARQRVIAMSIAFFCGLATTMVVLGASLTAIGTLFADYRDLVTRIGGAVIIVFGLLSVLGKGFSGMTFRDRPTASVAGTFVYGMTFAFGWTACVGPILGAVLTTLMTTGVSVLAGAALAFVYALGLATPLTLIAVFFGRLGYTTRLGKLLRGRGYTLHMGSQHIHLHTTTVINGVLLIVVGALLATGQLTWFTRQMANGVGAQIALEVESWLARIFGLGG